MTTGATKKRVVVLQSNYLPWKGYFDLIRSSDLLIFYDDTQYTKNDWRNRNLLKTPRGVEWMTIPCGPHHMHRLIQEIGPAHSRWQRSHWDQIKQNYRDAQYFCLYEGFLEDFYLANVWSNLSELNQYLIGFIAREYLQIKTPMLHSRDFTLKHSREERLVELLQQVGATNYLSGPSGKSFLRLEPFDQAGIKVEWMDYSAYRPYSQLFGPFIHEVSIIDLLLNEGPHATDFLMPFSSEVSATVS